MCCRPLSHRALEDAARSPKKKTFPLVDLSHTLATKFGNITKQTHLSLFSSLSSLSSLSLSLLHLHREEFVDEVRVGHGHLDEVGEDIDHLEGLEVGEPRHHASHDLLEIRELHRGGIPGQESKQD